EERLRRDGLDVLGGHALPDHALHAGEADADLVLDQLADGTDAPVGEVVLVVEPVAGLGVHEMQQVGARGEDLAAAEDRLALLGAVEEGDPVLVGAVEHREELGEVLDLVAQLLVELVAADPAEVVAAALEEGVVEVGAGGLDGGRLTRTGPLVDLDERLLTGGGDLAVLLPLALEEVEVPDEGV